MSYNALNDVTGIGKFITIRNKETGVPFTLGMTEDEVAVSDGEQKYLFNRYSSTPMFPSKGMTPDMCIGLGITLAEAMEGTVWVRSLRQYSLLPNCRHFWHCWFKRNGSGKTSRARPVKRLRPVLIGFPPFLSATLS